MAVFHKQNGMFGLINGFKRFAATVKSRWIRIGFCKERVREREREIIISPFTRDHEIALFYEPMCYAQV